MLFTKQMYLKKPCSLCDIRNWYLILSNKNFRFDPVVSLKQMSNKLAIFPVSHKTHKLRILTVHQQVGLYCLLSSSQMLNAHADAKNLGDAKNVFDVICIFRGSPLNCRDKTIWCMKSNGYYWSLAKQWTKCANYRPNVDENQGKENCNYNNCNCKVRVKNHPLCGWDLTQVV